jgi:hypothetical protein
MLPRTVRRSSTQYRFGAVVVTCQVYGAAGILARVDRPLMTTPHLKPKTGKARSPGVIIINGYEPDLARLPCHALAGCHGNRCCRVAYALACRMEPSTHRYGHFGRTFAGIYQQAKQRVVGTDSKDRAVLAAAITNCCPRPPHALLGILAFS